MSPNHILGDPSEHLMAFSGIYGGFELPPLGHPFSMDKMPQVPRTLFKRVSEIYQVDTSGLMPLRGADLSESREIGHHDFECNTVSLRPPRGDETLHAATLEHELIHSATGLVNPSTYRAMVAFALADRALRQRPGFGGQLKYFGLKTHGSMISTNNSSVDENVAHAASSTETITNRKLRNLGNFVEKYGADGALLLIAENPNISNPEIRILEAGYLRSGLIHEVPEFDQHALTDKGVGYVQELMPRHRLMLRLRRIEKNREILRNEGKLP